MKKEIKKEKILVVEDDETLQMVFQRALESKGYQVDLVEDGREALRLVSQNQYLMVFMDIIMPESSGLETLEKLKKIDPSLVVVIMTAENTMRNAIEAMRRGAYDYLSKPIDLEEIFLLVERAGNEADLRGKMRTYERELKERFEVGEIIGKSRKIQEIFKIIGKAAPTDLTVLIRGESGTGKELVARALHYNSPRVVFPFIAVNCAAIPKELLESELFGHEKGAFTGAVELKKGKFELAEKGTLFLDEIGDMDIGVQAKILRVLQEKEYHRIGGKETLRSDARIIAATNQDLKAAIKEKRFRDDLYHRLNVIYMELPPLRERKEDIPRLVEYFLQKSGGEMRSGPKMISQEALQILSNSQWPGNIRQLENTIKQCLALSSQDTIFPEHLPGHLRESTLETEGPRECEDGFPSEKQMEELLSRDNKGALYQTVIRQTEKKLISSLLHRCDWNQVKAADWLGINRNTLKRKMDELGIKKL
ncbi:MAG: sigma-54-dependent Fis family transcriptional regulator [Nitrospinae bacterium]|nr:sigma-54-dependent Fis family transcriptional regulator [Nitrospinota bacterium]